MNKQLVDTVAGIFFICFGLWFAIFSKQLAYKTATIYFKLLHLRFSERGYRIAFLIAGIAFVIFGTLAVLRIIRFK